MKETLGITPRIAFPFAAGIVPSLFLSWALASCTPGHRGRGGDVPRPAAKATVSTGPTVAADGSSAPAAPQAPRAHRVGTVRVIGDRQRFVLFEVPPDGAGPLPDGLLLHCSASPTGEASANATLRISAERRRPYIVADVVSGEPHVGDAVFVDRALTNQTPGGPTVLPTATAGVLPIVIPGATAPASRP